MCGWVFHDTNGQNQKKSIEDSEVLLERNLYGLPLAASHGRDNSEEAQSDRIGNVCLFVEKKNYSDRYVWMTSK